MKITKITTIPLRFPYKETIYSAMGTISKRESLLVKIETDKGIYGIGEASTNGGPLESTKTILDKELTPSLIGEDPLQIEKIWQNLYWNSWTHGRRGIFMCALSGIEIALWDILGKVANMPVYKLLGAYSNKVDVYGSAGYYASNKGNDELVKEILSLLKKGHKAIKMKIGRNPEIPITPIKHLNKMDFHSSIEQDLKRVKEVRSAIGPNIRLMVDANVAWDEHTAITVGRELQKQNVFWIEEPTTVENIQGSANIARELDMLVAGYETEQGIYGYKELISQNAVDVVQPSITRVGGFTGCKTISSLAYAHHKTVAPHCFGSAVSLLAAAHFSASISNLLYLEMDENPNDLRTELVEIPLEVNNQGQIHLSDKPGLGIELREDIIEKYYVNLK